MLPSPDLVPLVRQLLGHRNVQTTINAYIGLENIHASEIFSKIVMEHMDDKLEAEMTGTQFSNGKPTLRRPRSLPVSEWPNADQRAWDEGPPVTSQK